jgi:hypothetical protein
MRLADRQKDSGRASGGARGARFGGYGRGERSGAETFQLTYVIAPTAGLLVEVA